MGGGACDGGEVSDSGGPLADLLSDLGRLVGRFPNEVAQISGAGDNFEPEVVEAFLGLLDYCGFDNENGFGQFREVIPCRPRSH